jgi:hypothetical protein
MITSQHTLFAQAHRLFGGVAFNAIYFQLLACAPESDSIVLATPVPRPDLNTAPSHSNEHVGTYLQYLQLLQPLLYKLLHFPLLSLALRISESITRSPFGVFAKVVGSELSTLS